MVEGVLYWITGLSGAGKTTVGNRLYYEIKKFQSNVVILDGDILKNILSPNPGYTYEDRKVRAYQYARLCKSLTDQGIVVICCTIAMFEEVRAWNRANNKKYVEIYIDTPKDVLVKRNQKGLYSDYIQGHVINVVGEDVDVDLPKKSDLVIVNDENNDIDENIKRILEITPIDSMNYSRDSAYWDVYYEQNLAPVEPSMFAKYAISYMKPNTNLLELGCGNGRDSLFFVNKDIRVIAVDASSIAVKNLNNVAKKNSYNLWGVCDDFVSFTIIKTMQFDYIYSRFTWHSINERQEEELLKNIQTALKKDGLLFIEARSVKDPLYGKGDEVEKNAFKYNGHFRRFIVIDELVEKLNNMGLSILLADESTEWAINGNDNPPVIRIVCRKDRCIDR